MATDSKLHAAPTSPASPSAPESARKRARRAESGNFLTVKDLQTNRFPHERVQFSLSMSGDPEGPAPPSGFIVFDYGGHRELLEPYIIRLTHFFCGEWEAKPLFLPPILTYHGKDVGKERVGRDGCRAPLVNLNALLAFVRKGQRDGEAAMTALPILWKNSKTVAAEGDKPGDFPKGLLAFCRQLAADADMPRLAGVDESLLDIRLTMPNVPFGGFVAWQGVHGNASPYAPRGEREGRYAHMYILDTVLARRLAANPEAAADFAEKTRKWLDGTEPFSAHGGSNHKTGPHAAWLRAMAPEGKPAPDLPDMSPDEKDFFYTGQPLQAYTGPGHPMVPPSFLERVRTHGFAVVSPDDLRGIDKAAWLESVAAARRECDAHFAWVVYTRRGLPVPEGDIYAPLWGYKKAAEVVPGHPHIMNEGEVMNAQGTSLCSVFAGLGPATANSRGPAVMAMQTTQGIVRAVAQAFNGQGYIAPDRFRVKRYDGPLNLFTPHWDTIA